MSLSRLNQERKTEESRVDESLLGLEKTTKLVTSGIYQYIRHPMYSSLLFLGLGIYFKSPSSLGLVLFILVITFLALTAKAEELEDVQYFGDTYLSYMTKTKKFIPYIW
jgi:protein-S-isoprenylcysteine O-methyltransferase Ste14